MNRYLKHASIFLGISIAAILGATWAILTAHHDNIITIKHFGAKCDGVTDDTIAIQNAWNYAAKVHRNVRLNGAGPVCRITSLVMPPPSNNLPTIGEKFGWSMLTGDGATSVVLLASVSKNTCAITLSTIYGSNGNMVSRFGGFGLKQAHETEDGYGICISGVTKGTIDNVYIEGFEHGLHAVDTIRLDITNSRFYKNVQHINATANRFSRPNLWNIKSNWFEGAQQHALFLEAPDQINIQGNDFSSNGTSDLLSPSTIYIWGNPEDGRRGVSVFENYFEQNNGFSEVLIEQRSDQSGIHSIQNNTFNRNLPSPSASTPYNHLSGLLHIIAVANSGAGITTVHITGNYFLDFGDYSGSGSYISATYAQSRNYKFFCAANDFTRASLMPATCRDYGQ